jgi:hypothetical protein
MLCFHIFQHDQNSSSKVILKSVQINAGGANTCVEKLTFVLIAAAGLMGGGGKHGHGSSGGHGGGGGGGAAGTAINLAKSALASGAMGKKGMMASAVLGGGGGSHGGGGHGGGGSAGGLKLYCIIMINTYLFTVLRFRICIPIRRIHMFLGLPIRPLVRDTYRSGSGSFCHQAKKEINTLIPTVL